MPWSARDAKRHVKGLTPQQARIWARVANAALSRCLSDGGSQSECEGRAVRQANAVAQRSGAPASNHLLLIHTSLAGTPRFERLHGEDYLICQCVMAISGVLNQGYLREDALVPIDWCGVPVVLSHPSDDLGMPCSARSPSILNRYGIGQVFHARLGERRRGTRRVPSLESELWIHRRQLTSRGEAGMETLAKLEQGEQIECSTAFFSEGYVENGEFEGAPYCEVFTRIRPDHLALLPNEIGACSIADGCGAAMHLNQQTLTYEQPCACADPAACTCHEKEAPMNDETPTVGWRRFMHTLRAFVAGEPEEPPHPPPDPDDQPPPDAPDADEEEDEDESTPAEGAVFITEQTDRDVRTALEGCLAREMGAHATPFYIQDVDHGGQSFTYQMGERLCRRYWTQGTDGLITLTDTTEDVQRQTNYVPVPGTSGPVEQETYTMTTQGTVPTAAIKARVNALIHNERTGWSEGDRHHLETMSEAALIRLGQETIEREQPVVHEATSLEEAVARHIPEDFGMRETIASAVRRYERHKTRLIDIIVNTKSNPFTREELQRWDDTRLEQLVMMAGEALPDQTPPHVQEAANYTGRRMPQIRIVQDEDAGVPPPPDTLRLVVEKRRELGLMN